MIAGAGRRRTPIPLVLAGATWVYCCFVLFVGVALLLHGIAAEDAARMSGIVFGFGLTIYGLVHAVAVVRRLIWASLVAAAMHAGVVALFVWMQVSISLEEGWSAEEALTTAMVVAVPAVMAGLMVWWAVRLRKDRTESLSIPTRPSRWTEDDVEVRLIGGWRLRFDGDMVPRRSGAASLRSGTLARCERIGMVGLSVVAYLGLCAAAMVVPGMTISVITSIWPWHDGTGHLILTVGVLVVIAALVLLGVLHAVALLRQRIVHLDSWIVALFGPLGILFGTLYLMWEVF